MTPNTKDYGAVDRASRTDGNTLSIDHEALVANIARHCGGLRDGESGTQREQGNAEGWKMAEFHNRKVGGVSDTGGEGFLKRSGIEGAEFRGAAELEGAGEVESVPAGGDTIPV